MEQLNVREGVLEISKSRLPLFSVPISNQTKHEIILPKRTQLGSIQHGAIKRDRTAAEEDEMSQPSTVKVEVNSVTTIVTPVTEQLLPPVDLSHLNAGQNS